MTLLALTEENFDQTIAEWITLVDFYAERCWPCKILGKLMPHLAKKYEWRAVVGKVNTDVSFLLTQKYAIFSLPTVVVFKDWEQVERLKWLQPPEAYSAVLDKWLTI